MVAEIFLQATADEANKTDTVFPMHSHLVLSHVCALWRAVALHTPSLWCRVVLRLGDRTTGFSGIKSLAKTCFERSGNLPLALTITSSVSNPSTIPNLSMELILPVRHRIRHLKLRLPVVFTESVFKLPKNSLRALKSISISAPIPSEEGPWFRAMSALEGAPLLESVAFSWVPHPAFSRQRPPRTPRFDPTHAGLPWDQLTELRLRNFALLCKDALHVLEIARALRRCSLHLLTPATSNTVSILLYSDILSSLEVVFTGRGSTAARFLDTITLPSLKDLSITINHDAMQSLPCATLEALQTRSSFSLDKFSLADRTGDTLLPFLQLNPRLTSLALTNCALELIPLTLALTYKPAGDSDVTLLPDLRSLALSDHWKEIGRPRAEWTRAIKVVTAMVESRRRTALVDFAFGSSVALNATEKTRLTRACADGMRISVAKVRFGL
ncbi:hypothetical protein B0H16DRAFT_1411504 [Mycena metata]|uniref:F-box domain-containing protein n=1 Tax=Mycena metata TaxID=1033252 RepID=A0AAD7JR56_9AGAR|nr:hypothetical protein B0H16DRAFT_1411504 [Mycena metata]